MNRRLFLLASVATAALAACASPPPGQTPGRKPNVVLILCDDLGYGDLGVFGNGMIRTPNIDRMAAEGARLTTFYASANVCTPSRAGLMTGRYPIRTGLARDVIRQTDTNGLPLSEITIAEALKPDYATALVGKWHLGHVAPFWPPTKHGFDLFYGLPYSHDMKPLKMYDAEPGVEITEEDPQMDRLTERFFARGFKFIEANKDRPFFLMLTLTAPHVPLDPHPDHAGHSAAAEYGDVVEEIDDNVGKLMQQLKSLGIDQDTLVILTSDNGPWWEGSSGGLRDRKGGAGWEGGYRVPFIARQPGRIPAGRTSDLLVSNYDFLPTVLGHLGLADRLPREPQLPGRDVSPLLAGGTAPQQGPVFYEMENTRAIRTDRWKLVRRHPDGPHELYDMQADPMERVNLFGQPGTDATAQALRRDLERFFATYADPRYDLWRGGTSKAPRLTP